MDKAKPTSPGQTASTGAPTESPVDLSGYDRNVRSDMFRQAMNNMADDQVDDAGRRANNSFHDRNAEPFTRREEWLYRIGWGVVGAVIALAIVAAVFFVSKAAS